MNTEAEEYAQDQRFATEEIRTVTWVYRDELDAQTAEYERVRDDERA